MLHVRRTDRSLFRRALVVSVALVVAFGVVVPAVGVAQTSNDRYEPNDTRSSAASISEGLYSDLYIDSGESDYFAISLDAGDSLSTSIDFDHSDGDLDLAVYGPDGDELSSSISTTDGESVSITADQSGIYYIEAYGFSGASGSYSLDVDVSGGPSNDRYEPNDRRSSAASISEGTYSNLYIDSGESDYFAISLDAGDSLSTSIDFDHSDGDLDLAVYGPDGDELSSSVSTTDGESVSITADESGTYYVEAYGYAGASGSYSLDVSAPAGGGGTGSSGTISISANTTTAAPGSTATITYAVTNTGDEAQAVIVHTGLGDMSGGWTVESRDDAGATWRPSDGTWLIQQLDPGETVTPSVTVSVPPAVNAPSTQRITVEAQTQNSAASVLIAIPIRSTAIRAVVDRNGNGQIDDMEILRAIQWWRQQTPVPGVGEPISDTKILELIDEWSG